MTEDRKRPLRVRGFLGEQSFELTEGWSLVMESIAEAMVYNSTYRSERQQETLARVARMNARDAVKSFKKAQLGGRDE